MRAQAVRNHSFGPLKLNASNAAAAALAHPVTHFFMLFVIVTYLVYGDVVSGIRP